MAAPQEAKRDAVRRRTIRGGELRASTAEAPRYENCDLISVHILLDAQLITFENCRMHDCIMEITPGCSVAITQHGPHRSYIRASVLRGSMLGVSIGPGVAIERTCFKAADFAGWPEAAYLKIFGADLGNVLPSMASAAVPKGPVYGLARFAGTPYSAIVLAEESLPVRRPSLGQPGAIYAEGARILQIYDGSQRGKVVTTPQRVDLGTCVIDWMPEPEGAKRDGVRMVNGLVVHGDTDGRLRDVAGRHSRIVRYPWGLTIIPQGWAAKQFAVCPVTLTAINLAIL